MSKTIRRIGLYMAVFFVCAMLYGAGAGLTKRLCGYMSQPDEPEAGDWTCTDTAIIWPVALPIIVGLYMARSL